MKIKLVAGLVLTYISTVAQDPEFTQFYANPLYLNPAFAGSEVCPRMSFNYRNQWPNLTGTFVTYSASYDQYVRSLSGGLGILVMSDIAGEGTLTTNNVSGIYSYQANITRKFSLKAGLQVTYAQKRVDWSKLTFGDMIDPRRGFVYSTKEIPGPGVKNNIDFSTGIVGFSKKYFFGVAVHHLTQPDESLLGTSVSTLPMKYTGHAGAMIPLDGRRGDTYLSPNILYQQQQDFKQLNLGFYVLKGPIAAGFWYRNRDAFIALVGLQRGLFRFGYSYDITVSKLANVSAGSHEISFTYQLKCKPPKIKFNTVGCTHW